MQGADEKSLPIVRELADRKFQRYQSPILVLSHHFAAGADDARVAGLQVALDVAIVFAPLRFRHQHGYIAAQQRRSGIAEYALDGRIGVADHAASVYRHDRIVQIAQIGPFPGAGRRELHVELAVFQQQRDQHEARSHQAIGAPHIPADVVTTVVQHCGQRDIEYPDEHDDHQPHVEQRMRFAPPEQRECGKADDPDGQRNEQFRAAIQIAVHDLRQQSGTTRGEQHECGGKG